LVTASNNIPILCAENLVRDFGTRKSPQEIRRAVNGVSLTINKGDIVGLLGPNGAGKTTTVKMCATLLTPTAGTITIAGIDAVRHPRAARRRTGLVLGGESGFYTRATARKNLLFFADVAGLASRERNRRVSETLELVQLTERADDPVRAYSRGMKQRLHIARSLLTNPELLLLDEPTSGLDPQIAAEIRVLVRDLAASGVGILLTSHHLGEVEQLANRIQVAVGGQEVAAGTVADIAAASGVSRVTTFSTSLTPTSLRQGLHQVARPLEVFEQAGRWQVRVPWVGKPAEGLIAEWFTGQGQSVPPDLVTRPATLEESYLALVAKEGENE
jgi:ABC-2 type transport system ATP-binding protein